MEEHPQARFIIQTLAHHGFVAYYAGGWVRDYLLQKVSDDIDIATNALPETIQTLFPHTVPIGIAFGIVLVCLEGHQYEVATFRQDFDYTDGRRPSQVQFSTAEEDAKRRDFTVNGMFYDPLRHQILDFVNGQKDLQAKIIRAIGNPHERIKEDRLRMIRAARLACRFDFTIDPATEQAIRTHANELFPAVAIERVWQELSKGLAFKKLQPMLLMLHDFGLLASIFPQLKPLSQKELENRLSPLSFFPPDAPLIAHLLELFPHFTRSEALDLCTYLKVSNADVQFVMFLFHLKSLLQTKTAEDIEWAYFYAHPLSSLCLKIIAAHLDKSQNQTFMSHHEARRHQFAFAIDRIQKRTPLLTAHDLIAAGILPGPKMGRLLKAAEKIAINQKIEDKEKILAILKMRPDWA
jgi:poly(A) polymerase